jgi:hypothetical protein
MLFSAHAYRSCVTSFVLFCGADQIGRHSFGENRLLNHLDVHGREFILTFSSFHSIVMPLSISYYMWLM